MPLLLQAVGDVASAQQTAVDVVSFLAAADFARASDAFASAPAAVALDVALTTAAFAYVPYAVLLLATSAWMSFHLGNAGVVSSRKAVVLQPVVAVVLRNAADVVVP